MDIEFLLNGETTRVTVDNPTMTALDWLREKRGLKGTKEGCNEGDCGACTVMVGDENNVQSMNACILFLPQLNGKSVRTVEGLANGDTLHPVQKEMIEKHGSQCGFCTPGFVVSMATAHANDATDHDDQLAGNLCRCTGYAPIIRAAKASETQPKPKWLEDDRVKVSGLVPITNEIVPKSLDEFAAWYALNPDATLISGATDVGLWVTKSLRDLGKVCFLRQLEELKVIEKTDEGLSIGASVSISDLRKVIESVYPSFAEMLRRYGSTQVRNAATIGGNIANGSPIGDTPPALIALDAKLVLRKGQIKREIDLEKYFVEYGKQDIRKGEFVESVFVPEQINSLKCYKLSKRFDQDISAVCGCFNIGVEAGKVSQARIAFGGMAGTPKRARNVEKALIGKAWTKEIVCDAMQVFGQDYTPMSDMRAGSEYRLRTAENMLLRYFVETVEGHQQVVGSRS